MSGDKLEHFCLADLVAQANLISFHLSWNWNMDMAREAIRESHPDLADIVEELVPFSTEFLSTVVTSIDDEDLKQWGQYSEETLQERYNKARETIKRANAPLDPEIIQWQDSLRARRDLTSSVTTTTHEVLENPTCTVSQLEEHVALMKIE